jgi:hypothetical protein
LLPVGRGRHGALTATPHSHNQYRNNDCQESCAESHVEPDTLSRLGRRRAILFGNVGPDLFSILLHGALPSQAPALQQLAKIRPRWLRPLSYTFGGS